MDSRANSTDGNKVHMRKMKVTGTVTRLEFSLEDIQSLAISGELFELLPEPPGDDQTPPPQLKFDQLVPLDLRTAPGTDQDKFADYLSTIPR